MVALPRRSGWLLLALLAGVALVVATIWLSARKAVEAPLEPALGPSVATLAPAQPAPGPSAAEARVELSGEPAAKARAREWAIWRELHRPRPKGKRRPPGKRGAGGWRAALVLELGELARAGSPVAVELLRSPDEGARNVALEMLSTPALASPLVLDLLVQARPELAQAGLRREARAAVRTVSNHLRRRRRPR